MEIMENRSWIVLSCEFNIDTACVEIRHAEDGFDCKSDCKMMSIYCPAVENPFAENMYERSTLTSLCFDVV